MTNQFDVAVLGAGIVGVSTAIHLRRSGLSVALVDRRGPGEETSHGNAGIIQREGVDPYLFPRSIPKLFSYALNRRVEANYHLKSIGKVAPFLWRYFRGSSPAKARETREANIPLFERCLTTHGELIEASGAGNLIARSGWLAAYRNDASVRRAEAQVRELNAIGINASMLTPAQLSALEPDLNTSELAAAVHYRDPWTVSDPGALTKAYAALFEREGGEFIKGDVSSIRFSNGHWRLPEVKADVIVVALGPWSKRLLDAHGVVLPMGVKRGYHQHYAARDGAVLTRPMVDDDNGFVIAPMARGIRLTSGAEFAEHEAPPSPVQIRKAEPIARALFPLGEAVDKEPWMGARPVFPDMRPAVGKIDALENVWVNFGHAHHGLTLGPATGMLLAQMMTGEQPFCDPEPFSPQRFLAGA